MKSFLLMGGFDSTGGAGILADLRVCNSLGLNPYCVTTGTAVQNNRSFVCNFLASKEEILNSLESVFSEAEIEFAKIGMIGSKKNALLIADFLTERNVKIILDTPLKTSSGGILQSPEMLSYIANKSFLITPNKEEFDVLSRFNLEANILVKSFAGGVDRLFYKDGRYKDFILPHIAIQHNVRGTGCSLASAICAFMFKGEDIENAIIKAKAIVYKGMQNAKNVTNGYILQF